MDAYSICRTSPSRRASSKVYQDLKVALFSSWGGGDGRSDVLKMASTQSAAPKRQCASISKPHVAIIGAGLSGLRCADILLHHGFTVTILEARDRIGGRVHQQHVASGHMVDLGPNWIHGTDENPILDLAKQTNTSVGSWDNTTRVYDPTGSILSLKEGERYSSIVWDIVQQAFEYSNNFGAEIPVNNSLLDFIHEKILDMVPESDPEFAKKREIVLHIAEMWGAFIGSPVSRQSLKYFWLEECIEGENLFCAGTYKRILDLIAAPALRGADIRLNSKAKQISYHQEGNKVTIKLEDGEQLIFDEVVVTTPLGWLKRNLDAFKPALPSRLTQAINAIGYGCLEKVYITFPTAFWLHSDTSNKVNGFIEWLTPSYAPRSNPKQWHQEAVDLAGLDSPDAHPTLLFYMFGEQSKYITSALANLPTGEGKNKFLTDFFHPYFSRLPNYAADSYDCQPVGFLATEWSSDELAGFGSYSNFQIGLEKGDEDISVMREGLPDDNVWFAGEHTAPFVALGTATGAYWSGEMVGKRIVDAYTRALGCNDI